MVINEFLEFPQFMHIRVLAGNYDYGFCEN